MIEGLKLFFLNGFETAYLGYIFWFGYLPFIFAATAIEKAIKPLPKIVDLVLLIVFTIWSFALLGRLGVMLYFGAGPFWDGILTSGVATGAEAYAKQAYALLDSYLALFTSYVLLVGPLIAVALIDLDNLKIKVLSFVLWTWFAVSFLVLTFTAFNVISDNPISALLFAATIPIVNLYGFSTRLNLRKVYSTNLIHRDFVLANEFDEDGRMSQWIRGMTLVLVISAFWFQLTISTDTQHAFFTAVIGGLLAIVGFAALVFTFTHERLPTPAMGRQIGADTRAAQKAAGATLMCALVGLLMTTGPLSLEIRALGPFDMIRATALFVAVVGFAYAIDSALVLFRHVVEVMVEVDTRDTSMTVIFEEGNIQHFQSATYKEANGFSQFREAFEGAGCKTLVARSVQWNAIFRQERPIFVLGPRISPYDQRNHEWFRSYVERGGILLVLTAHDDLHTKEALLKLFDIQITKRQAQYWGAARQHREIDGERRFQERHDAFISLRIHPNPDCEVLLETTYSGADHPFVCEPLAISQPFGKGKVIVVGSRQLFTNKNFQPHRTHLFLDRIIETAERHFAQLPSAPDRP